MHDGSRADRRRAWAKRIIREFPLKLRPEPAVTLTMRTYCNICGTVGTEPVLTSINLPNDRRAGSARRYHVSCEDAVIAQRAACDARSDDDRAVTFNRFVAARRAERASVV